MKYFNTNPIYTIIDIGTTKIIVIIAEKKISSDISILGLGVSPSYGLERGMVMDIEKTSLSIKKALDEASSQANINPEYVTIGISGHHIKSYFSQGMASISSEKITQETIDETLLAAQSIVLPEDEKIIHTIPLAYIIDGYNNTSNPIGRHGVRLEINTHIITANKNAIEDLVSCCKELNLKIKDIILEPVASCEAILNEEEKIFGSLVIDIGGGTSDIALYKKNSIEFIEILSMGGVLFTNDIAICLNCNQKEAEKIKKEYGLLKKNINTEEPIYIKSLDFDTEIETSCTLIYKIINARAEELIKEVSYILEKYNHTYEIPSGIILTGGGALLKGLPEMFSKYTSIRCRVGYPNVSEENSFLKNPKYSTAYGLLLHTIQHDKRFSGEKYSIKSFFRKFIEPFIS